VNEGASKVIRRMEAEGKRREEKEEERRAEEEGNCERRRMWPVFDSFRGQL
jgi:hypothetical protein